MPEPPAARRLIVVTGASCLEQLPEAARWARQRLEARLSVEPGGTVVLGGDDAPPGRWAREAAEQAGLGWVLYLATGERASMWNHPSRWHPGPAHPLARNRALARAAARAAARGWDVSGLALLAGWSLSPAWDGHAAWCLERAGVRVERLAHPGLLGGLEVGLAVDHQRSSSRVSSGRGLGTAGWVGRSSSTLGSSCRSTCSSSSSALSSGRRGGLEG